MIAMEQERLIPTAVSRQATSALQSICSQGRLVPFGSSKGRTYQLPP